VKNGALTPNHLGDAISFGASFTNFLFNWVFAVQHGAMDLIQPNAGYLPQVDWMLLQINH